MSQPNALKYRVAYDPEVTFQSDRTYMRKNRAAYLKNYFQWGLWLVPFGFAMFVFPAQVTLSRGWGAGTLTYVACAFVSGVFYSYSTVQHQLETVRKPTGEEWECELTDDAWVFTNSDKMSSVFPWSVIEIIFETEDTWVIKAGGSEITVYRKPLREAGLESEFLSRVQAAHAHD